MYKSGTTLILLIVFLFSFTSLRGQSSVSAQANKVGQTLFYIERLYLDTTNIERLTDNALVSIMKELDPHSSYISKKDIQAMNEPLQGNFDGIGVEFALINDTLTINSTIPGGPSEKVGIRAGDKIVAVDGEVISGTGLTIESPISPMFPLVTF